MKTVVGLFENTEDADRAVDALQDAGFVDDNMVAMAQNRIVEKNVETPEGETKNEEAGRTIALGGLAGLLAGAATFAIPGIGPVVATGSLAAELAVIAAGGGIGAAIGSAAGAFIGLGIPEEDAEVYEEGVKRGNVLVAVQAEGGRADLAANILKKANAINVEERRREWKLT